MKEILHTRDLCREFVSGPETVRAVDAVSLSVLRGKLTVLCGPSGSGKTTLLNLLGALDPPTSGSIHFDGRDVTAMTETQRDELRRTRMGFVFQSIGLIAMLSACENVEFGLRVSGEGRERGKTAVERRRERAETCLEAVGMWKRRQHRPHELSVGEQQRVAIARAMAHRPDVIFADEPTSALDTLLGLQVVSLFKELVDKEKMSIVMATHNPHFMELADTLYTLDNGRLIERSRA
jgi:putative ABC transport system ATP-binding protein